MTDSDYPPFHYYDEVGALTGFNVDLAKAICEELEVQCEVTAVAWEDLIPSLDKGDADAAIASIRITAEALEKADFTLALLRDARALRRGQGERSEGHPPRDADRQEDRRRQGHGPRGLSARNSSPQAAVASFDTADDAQKALKDGAIDLVFGDGIGLTFWINGVTSEGCCEFRGGPYLDTDLFRRGRRHRGEEGQPPDGRRSSTTRSSRSMPRVATRSCSSATSP